jgi:hypothetical protein
MLGFSWFTDGLQMMLLRIFVSKLGIVALSKYTPSFA